MGRRKHVMQGLGNELEAPTAGQRVVRAVGSRGGNIVEVEFPNGGTTLCILPQKFNKTLYVKKGGYLLIAESAAPGSSNATAALCARPSSPSSHQEQPVSSPGTQASAAGCGTMPATKKAATGGLAPAGNPTQLPAPQDNQLEGSTSQGSGLSPVAHPPSLTPTSATSPAAQAVLPASVSAPPPAGGAAKVTGHIVAVLYDSHIKQLKKYPGVWPHEFTSSPGTKGEDSGANTSTLGEEATIDECSDGSGDDSMLVPLHLNTNRKVIVHYASSGDDDSD